MKTLLLLLILTVVACSQQQENKPNQKQRNIKDGLVVSGSGSSVIEITNPLGNPPRGDQCTGTIIGSRTILTAAHCVEGLNPQDITIRTSNNMRYGVDQIVRHPDAYGYHSIITFVPRIRYYTLGLVGFTSGPDLALLRLSSRTSLPAVEIDLNPVAMNESLQLFGYGIDNGNDGGVLKDATMVVFAFADSLLRRVGRGLRTIPNGTFILKRGETRQALCQGDDGAPALRDGLLVSVGTWFAYQNYFHSGDQYYVRYFPKYNCRYSQTASFVSMEIFGPWVVAMRDQLESDNNESPNLLSLPQEGEILNRYQQIFQHRYVPTLRLIGFQELRMTIRSDILYTSSRVSYLIREYESADALIWADVNLLQSPNRSHAGLIARARGGDCYVGRIRIINGLFYPQIFRVKNGKYRRISRPKTPPIALGTGRLALQVIGNRIQLYLNDVLVSSAVDPTPLPKGGTGLIGRGNAAFDNFEVITLAL